MKEVSEKVGLKLNIQKTKIMASSPITSWEIDEIVEIVADFILGGTKITEDGECSHEIKRHLLLGRKVMTKLDMTRPCIVGKRPPGSKYRSTSGLSPREHLERQAEFHASTQDEA